MDVPSLWAYTWLLLLTVRVGAEVHTTGDSHPVYTAVVGEEINITCPCESGDDYLADGIFNWTKSPQLDSKQFVPHFFFEKTFKLKVRSARDGGYYRCSSYDQKDTTWLVELRVQPELEIRPSGTGIGIHTRKSATLECVGSGFPRPHIVWTTPHGDLKQTVSEVDEYSVSNQVLIESALQSMSGMYKCQACYSDSADDGGSCSSVESEIHISVFVYAECKVQLISQLGRELEKNHALNLECRVMCDDRLTYSVIWKHNSIELQPNTPSYAFEKSPPSYYLTVDEVNSSHAGSYSCVITSIYKEEEAMDTIDIKVVVENGFITLTLVTIITGVCTLIGVYFCAMCSVRTKSGMKGRMQWSGRDAYVQRTQQNKIDFRQYASQHQMNFHALDDNNETTAT